MKSKMMCSQHYKFILISVLLVNGLYSLDQKKIVKKSCNALKEELAEKNFSQMEEAVRLERELVAHKIQLLDMGKQLMYQPKNSRIASASSAELQELIETVESSQRALQAMESTLHEHTNKIQRWLNPPLKK